MNSLALCLPGIKQESFPLFILYNANFPSTADLSAAFWKVLLLNLPAFLRRKFYHDLAAALNAVPLD